jgi:adenylylsulfate kinase-like enzyme
MFRCIASNIRLIPLCKREPTRLLVRSRLTSPSTLIQPPWRRCFTSTQSCLEKVKQEAVTKPAHQGDVKKLFRLAKPELKNLTGENKNVFFFLIHVLTVCKIIAATGLLVISSAITMVTRHNITVLEFLPNAFFFSLFLFQWVKLSIL